MDEWARGWAKDDPQLDTSSLLPVLRLARLGVLIDAFQTDVLEPFELAPSDYEVLAALKRTGRPYALSPSQLYGPLRRSSGGMTKILKRLEQMGLIERQPNPEDGRSVRVNLTARGVSMHDRAFRGLAAGSNRLLAKLMEMDRGEIDAALGRLLGHLEATDPNATNAKHE